MNKVKEIQLEEAFKRLEEISKEMNASEVELEKSLHLYEEASKLINSCKKKLEEAENKIEILTKEHGLKTFDV